MCLPGEEEETRRIHVNNGDRLVDTSSNFAFVLYFAYFELTSADIHLIRSTVDVSCAILRSKDRRRIRRPTSSLRVNVHSLA